MTVPADFRLAAQRLDDRLKRTPEDLTVRLALADMYTRLDDLKSASSVLAAVARGGSPPGLVLGRYGYLLAIQDDLDGAREMLGRCLSFLPGSAACASGLAGIEMNEGRCSEAERVLRREISASPNADAYLHLASSIEKLGAPPEEVQPVLDSWVRLSPADERQRNATRAQIRVDLLQGRLRDALDQYDTLKKSLEGVDDDVEQFYYTAYRMLLEAEVGEHDAAAQTLARYVSARQAYQREVDGGDNVTYLFALGAEFGVVPWPEWIVRRDERLSHSTERDEQLDGRARSWLDNYAMPAVTPAAAREALAVLPRFQPILHRSDREYWDDSAIGRVYALNGQVAAAVPYYERAVASCDGLEDLVQFSRAESDFADLLAREGRLSQACALYEKVVSRWPVASGSVTAKHAASQLNTGCTSLTPKEKSK